MTAAIPPEMRLRMASAVRILAMDTVAGAGSGHPGMPLGMADAATALFADTLRIDPACPDWPDRDRLVLSAGHGSALLYVLYHLAGCPKMTARELGSFRQLHASTAGHPEYGVAAGVEATTGPLGQGLAMATGMALAERLLNARFGDALVDHHTFVLAGDGCLMEGISHEALELAVHLRLGRLIVLWDDNGITIDGGTGLTRSSDQAARFLAAGWQVFRLDGHDQAAVTRALGEARACRDQPSLLACRTVIGAGIAGAEGSSAIHGTPPTAAQVASARRDLDWSAPPFVVPDDIRQAWSCVATRGRAARLAFEERLKTHPRREAFLAALRGTVPEEVRQALDSHRRQCLRAPADIATRVASQAVIGTIAGKTDLFLSGSADLTPSSGTRAAGMTTVSAGNFHGNYLHYGVREHAMAAIMNGIALHRGLIPCGGTFLCFSDYSRPAIRLGALMGVRVIHVMSHDSIGLGEDGPTHQPVEHLATLRAIPGLYVMRPADAAETTECWLKALETEHAPSVICLSRQNLPAIRLPGTDGSCFRGARILLEPDGPRDGTILATGSEVSLALEAADSLAREGWRIAVVSMPCLELFAEQDEAFRRRVLGDAPRLAVEAGIAQGWERWTGPGGGFAGLSGFGASAPGPVLFRHFGLTAQAVAATMRRLAGPHRTPPEGAEGKDGTRPPAPGPART